MACTISSSLCFLLVALACLATSRRVEGGGPTMQHLVSIQSLLPRKICSSDMTGDHHLGRSNATTLSLVHKHGPCSPLGHQGSLSPKQILDEDQARVDMLHRRTSTASSRGKEQIASTSKIPANTGTSVSTGNYIVTIGFGSPKKVQTVIFDTGSDVTWIQCQPCVSSCYQQQDPIFNPSQSATYSNISCSSTSCSELDTSGCSSGTCLYGVQYGDSSFTVGFFAQDTLTVTPNDVIPNFQFGCGQNNQGLFGRADGLLGLGREKVSFISQTYQRYGGVFAYCLPSTSSSTGYLTFGGGGVANVGFTPMLSQASTPTFYYLSLISISVGGKTLPISPTVFSAGGMIIDSGTVITRLPPTAYSALRSAFRQLMSSYKSAPALSILDTCYDFTGTSNAKVPPVALQFSGGVTANLDVSGILYVAKVSQACLAFAANGADSDTGILGNVQQRKFNVVYDLSRQAIGFGSGGC